MTQAQADAMLKEWQENRKRFPKEVRLEEDYNAMLSIVDFALNTPDGVQGEPK